MSIGVGTVGTVGAVGAIAPPLFSEELAFSVRRYSPFRSAPRAPPPSLRTRVPAGSAPPLQSVFLHL